MSQTNLNAEKFTDLWLNCMGHQIQSGVELSAASLECLSKLCEIDSSAIKRETAHAVSLAQQCMEARSPVEVSSLVAEQWRGRMQEQTALAQQVGELLGNTAMQLNQFWQQHVVEMNKQCTSCLRSASSHGTGAGKFSGLWDDSTHNMPAMFGKFLESGKQLSDAWNENMKQVVPHLFQAAAEQADATTRKAAGKGAKAQA